MATRLHRLPMSQLPITSQLYPFRLPFTSRLHFPDPSISCCRSSSCRSSSCSSNRNQKNNKHHTLNAGADLSSSALAVQARKLKALAVEREEAMKKSSQLLFSELCGFAGISPLDMKNRWTNKMNEEDKLVLVTEFVSEWGTNFHPLSARSVGEMIEQYLAQEEEDLEKDQQLDSSGHSHSPFSLSSSSYSHSRLLSGWRNLFNGFSSKN